MQSKKAQEYIWYLDNKLQQESAIKAVVLAEAEMRERAIEAAKPYCAWYRNGQCLRSHNNCDNDSENDCYFIKNSSPPSITLKMKHLLSKKNGKIIVNRNME